MMHTLPQHREHCRHLFDELSEYLDGELSPARCRAIEAHLAACGCCGRLAGRVRKAIALCRSTGGPRLSAAMRREARARISALLDREVKQGPGGRTGSRPFRLGRT